MNKVYLKNFRQPVIEKVGYRTEATCVINCDNKVYTEYGETFVAGTLFLFFPCATQFLQTADKDVLRLKHPCHRHEIRLCNYCAIYAIIVQLFV
jgi:hypothetical protein